MPVTTALRCTLASVLEAFEKHTSVFYETDDSERLAEKLGFERNQAGDVFFYVNWLVSQKKVNKRREDVRPVRYQNRGPRQAQVRRVTFTLK